MNIGLALAGGGIRASAQLGVVQALHEKGIVPTIFAGTSAGAIVASLLALGLEPQKALQSFKSSGEHIVDIDYLHIIESLIVNKPIQGFAKGKALEEILDDMFGAKKFGDIQNKLAVVTTEITRGTQVIFSNVNPEKADAITDPRFDWVADKDAKLNYIVSASGSLPAIYVPKVYHGYTLVDGGVTNNLPADVVLALGADKVITIDLGHAGDAHDVSGVVGIIRSCIDVLMARVVDNNRNDFGIYLYPGISDVGVLDTHRIDECFERGYQYGLTVVDQVASQLA